MRTGIVCGWAASVAAALSGCGLTGGETPPPADETRSASPSATRSVTETPTLTPTPTPTAAAPMAWSEAFEKLGPAVVRIATTQCGDSGSLGSGFAVAPDLVVTAAHVVEEGRTISVQTPDGQTVSSEAVVVSRNTDTAVLRLAEGLRVKTVFTLADDVPVRGSELAVMGYPFGEYALSITDGIVSRLPGPVDYENQHVDRAFTTNADTNGGNSGGPVIDRSGRVIGLVSGGRNWDDDVPAQGINFVIPVEDIEVSVETAEKENGSLADVCDEDVEDPVSSEEADLAVTIEEDSEVANYVGQLLFTHGMAINTGAYEAAFELFTSTARRNLGGIDAWSQALAESYWDEVVVHSVATSDSGRSATAQVSLTTRQPPDGTTTECSVWTMAYEISLGDEMLIDKAKGKAAAC